MSRFIKAFRKHGLGTKYGAELVSYADDFVVLCRGNALQVLDVVRRLITRMGLVLNDTKTSVRDARREHFDFLGYTFGPLHSPRTWGRYNGARPSRKALTCIKEAVRGRLRPGNHAPVDEVVAALNRVLRGWANYFCYGSLAKARHDVDQYVEECARSLRQVPRPPPSVVLVVAGVVRLRAFRPQRRFYHEEAFRVSAAVNHSG